MAAPWEPQGDQRGGVLHGERAEGKGEVEGALRLERVDGNGGEVHLESVADLREHHGHQRRVLEVESGANLVSLRVVSLVEPGVLDEVALQRLQKQRLEGLQVPNLLASDRIRPA
jgi:hypothetical protein